MRVPRIKLWIFKVENAKATFLSLNSYTENLDCRLSLCDFLDFKVSKKIRYRIVDLSMENKDTHL